MVFLDQTHLELLLAVIHLHEQAMGSIPVPINDVCPAVAVEIRQSDAPAVLHGVLHPCGDISAVRANFRCQICPRGGRWSLTCLLSHVCKRSIAFVPEQEVGSVLVDAQHVRQGLADDGAHHYTSTPCADGGVKQEKKQRATLEGKKGEDEQRKEGERERERAAP